MSHLATVGVAGGSGAVLVGLIGAVWAGPREVVTALRTNGPAALGLALAIGVVMGVPVGIWFGGWLDALFIGFAGAAVGFVHGVDL